MSSWRKVGGAELAGVRGTVLEGRGQIRDMPLPLFSPAADMSRPPETTTAVGAVVTAPHSRARDTVGESLAHVPLETFLQTLESSGGSVSDSNNTGATGVPTPSTGTHVDPQEAVTFQPAVSTVVLAFASQYGPLAFPSDVGVEAHTCNASPQEAEARRAA